MSSSVKSTAAEHAASCRDCRPTERAQYVAETHKDKENHQCQQVDKAQERQEKACQKASKAAEREAYQKDRCTALSDTPPQGSVAPSVHDPGFTSQSVLTPVRENLVARKSVVPPAPHRISMGKTPRPNTLTPEKAAELLCLRDAVLAEQAHSPVVAMSHGVSRPALGLNHIVTHSPSPTDEDLFDDAIAGLADFEMDGEPMDEGSTTIRTIFSVAWALYCGHLCMEGAMPDRMQEVTWVKLAWNEACKRLQTCVAYDAEIIKMITSQGSHFHGEVKSKVQPYIADEYGFETSTKQFVIDRSIMLTRELKKNFAFVYKTCSADGNKGLYGSKIIQKAVNTMWFCDKKDEGVLYPEFYKPFPEVGLTLLLTAIESCIDEWSTGAQSNKMFTVDEYQGVLDEHLNNLTDFDEHTKAQGLLPKLLSHLHDSGCVHSKADPLGHDTGCTMARSTFDAAIKEYNDHGGVFSDSGDDE
ncbi:uncharacterized protein EDB91DRAFT_1085285 [Suillus paluster]|uniref:uncharacterized protein n=1 Tax=Suillus paluster TaxID=48578 RepID=UPI001B87FB74|nr:uncharacterized protein EDB91DRAFT_1085285 [Suillus paluster]KAG1730813.1 hypothetical protein EDB91DRAFT_1085285 [Suillus paluster]